jgi:16S rRNA processing protein RimM
MLEYLTVGIILKPHGLKGEVKVKPLTDDPRRFDNLQKIFLQTNKTSYKELQISSRRYDKGFVYLKFTGHVTIESIEPLRNKELWISRDMVQELPQFTYLIPDLLDCRVETIDGRYLGQLSQVMETGANDVYVVNGGPVGEVLIPALKKVITYVDIPNQLIQVDLSDMEGLVPDEN